MITDYWKERINNLNSVYNYKTNNDHFLEKLESISFLDTVFTS